MCEVKAKVARKARKKGDKRERESSARTSRRLRMGTTTMMTIPTRDPTSCGAPSARNLVGHGFLPSEAPLIEPIMITTLPNWKLYSYPFYDSPLKSPYSHKPSPGMEPDDFGRYRRRIKELEEQQARNLSLVSSLKAELDLGRRKMAELKSARMRAECEKERMRKDLERERAKRKVAEGVYDELAREIGKDRAGVEEMRRECERVREEVEEEEEESKRTRTADVGREERGQIKLAEARRVLGQMVSGRDVVGTKKKAGELPSVPAPPSNNTGGSVGLNKQNMIENPHIQMGIKGLVEFSRVVRSGVLKGKRAVSSKSECQKPLLKPYFLKQRVPVGFTSGRPENLVMG